MAIRGARLAKSLSDVGAHEAIFGLIDEEVALGPALHEPKECFGNTWATIGGLMGYLFICLLFNNGRMM